MSQVLPLSFDSRKTQARPRPEDGLCEIIIFPGVRIERHDLDLGHRVRDAAGNGDFDLDGSGGRRKSS